MWNPQFCFAFVFVFCRFKHISRGASGEEAQAGYEYSWSLFDSFHLGLKSSPCRKWDEVRRLTLAVWTCRLPAVHSVSRHLRATEQHALLCMSELCGPLKPRGPGLPIKMSWKLHFPISSGFWAEALWCKSKRIRALFFLASLYGILGIRSVSGDDNEWRWPRLLTQWQQKESPVWKGSKVWVPDSVTLARSQQAHIRKSVLATCSLCDGWSKSLAQHKCNMKNWFSVCESSHQYMVLYWSIR